MEGKQTHSSNPLASVCDSMKCRVFALTFGLIFVSSWIQVNGVNDAALPNDPNGPIPDIFIDLDEVAPGSIITGDNPGNVHVKIGQGHIVASGPKSIPSDIIMDDDEFFVSGSGSGSGDFDAFLSSDDVTQNVMTPTTSNSKKSPPGSDVTPISIVIKEGGQTELKKDPDEKQTSSFSLPQTRDYLFDDVDEDDDDHSDNLFGEDLDSAYDLPESSPLISNHVINPAAWSQWSKWFIVGGSSKLRVRTCQVNGQDVSEAACEGVRLQIKTCTDVKRNECGRVENIGTPVTSTVFDDKFKFLKVSNPPPSKKNSPAPNPDLCQFSLYDTFRHKYVFTRWNLTELITRSKVKKWCDKTSGQYIVMTTPLDHCWMYYKDLCKVSQRCRSNKPTRERGDFAEGCWRNHVYGDMLPIGLSNKQTIIYFICQRFAQTSTLGKTFGYRHTHFGTLYDTSMRSPVLSLAKISRLGDETWPDTEYLIEHGLVESEKSMFWFPRRPKKGMLSLRDLELCQDDQSCSVGLRQILPQDYREPSNREYVPTHLMWPELMPPEPAPRIATFTMTNMAPLHKSLFEEWHEAIKQVRKFAVQQCGVQLVLQPDLRYQSNLSSHRLNKSTLYLASGVAISQGPTETTGHDIRVPFLFWMAGCCVQQHTVTKNDSGTEPTSTKKSLNDEAFYESVDESMLTQTVNITSFSVYIRNTPGSHMIAAPVLQLELLLQDMYRAMPSDPDVTLFPGQESACSELQWDASSWFQK